ncbi:hypothetical protein SeMB42_g04420 [Synchytrium endobioticum]|uniref:Uncharacterized protein n=1 Tax=Synchytrium endobioticum TaxID=286115 RepID=A0A507CHZ4_9FUNG|nr:hypothetical protein SeLEV6574_g07360 [Synchytrium endobioticum]TPX44143.1 hypothetical protein SeMB42_g04420 [Synchytrium endobioticum]
MHSLYEQRLEREICALFTGSLSFPTLKYLLHHYRSIIASDIITKVVTKSAWPITELLIFVPAPYHNPFSAALFKTIAPSKPLKATLYTDTYHEFTFRNQHRVVLVCCTSSPLHTISQFHVTSACAYYDGQQFVVYNINWLDNQYAGVNLVQYPTPYAKPGNYLLNDKDYAIDTVRKENVKSPVEVYKERGYDLLPSTVTPELIFERLLNEKELLARASRAILVIIRWYRRRKALKGKLPVNST